MWVSRRPQQDGSESIFSNWYEHQGRKGPIFATALNEDDKSLEFPLGIFAIRFGGPPRMALCRPKLLEWGRPRWRESQWGGCCKSGCSHFWNHCGLPSGWVRLRKSLVEAIYLFIYWFNFHGDGFLLLKTQGSTQCFWVFFWHVCSQYGLLQGAVKLCLGRELEIISL